MNLEPLARSVMQTYERFPRIVRDVLAMRLRHIHRLSSLSLIYWLVKRKLTLQSETFIFYCTVLYCGIYCLRCCWQFLNGFLCLSSSAIYFHFLSCPSIASIPFVFALSPFYLFLQDLLGLGRSSLFLFDSILFFLY